MELYRQYERKKFNNSQNWLIWKKKRKDPWKIKNPSTSTLNETNYSKFFDWFIFPFVVQSPLPDQTYPRREEKRFLLSIQDSPVGIKPPHGTWAETRRSRVIKSHSARRRTTGFIRFILSNSKFKLLLHASIFLLTSRSFRSF